MNTATTEISRFLPVALATFCPTADLGFDLYLYKAGGGKPVLYRDKNYPLEAQDLARLRESGVDTLHIRAHDAIAYREYLRDQVADNESLPLTQRYAAIRDATRSVFNDALRNRSPERAVTVATDMGQQLSNLICNRDVILPDLFQLLQHDYYTFTHVVNVSTYSLLLAQRLGWSDSQEMAAMATGGLLHDLGKRHIPAALLNKNGKPTKEEWKVIKQHPTTGFEELCMRDDLSWAQLMMVYQHHERLDGKGYPVGIDGRDVHPWARICAIADVFDALTCERPYRKPMSTTEACGHLTERNGAAFDREMVKCWMTYTAQTG